MLYHYTITEMSNAHDTSAQSSRSLQVARSRNIADATTGAELDDDEIEIMMAAPSSPPQCSSTPSIQPIMATPASVAVKTITHTTTIPMQFSPHPSTPRHQHFPSAGGSLSQPGTPATTTRQPPVADSPFPANALRPDGTLDREAALEQIRQRRGRARSVAMGCATPRKQVEDQGLAGRRDISAPVRAASKAWTKG